MSTSEEKNNYQLTTTEAVPGVVDISAEVDFHDADLERIVRPGNLTQLTQSEAAPDVVDAVDGSVDLSPLAAEFRPHRLTRVPLRYQ